MVKICVVCFDDKSWRCHYCFGTFTRFYKFLEETNKKRSNHLLEYEERDENNNEDEYMLHEDDFCVKVVDCKGDAPSAAGSCNIDHSYSGGQKRSFDHLEDHSYQCMLYGQTDLDDEEEEEDVNGANTKLLLSMLPKCVGHIV